MTSRTPKSYRVGFLRSLKTQLFAGAIMLLGLALSVVSYFLIVQQKRTLTAEIERTVILQGRNIALSCAKFLLRADPEFEIYPLVTRILEDNSRIESISIVDAQGIVQGHKDLVRVSKPYEDESRGFDFLETVLLRDDEKLLESKNEYLFETPVTSSNQLIGTIYLRYSKADLYAGTAKAFRLTMGISAAAMLLGLMLSFIYFGRISEPIRAMMMGVKSLGEGNLDSRIDMKTSNEFRVLADSFNDMSSRIKKAQRELVTKERMDRELEIASDIQQSLIPRAVTSPPGFEIGHYYQAANEVGGDYLDVISIDEDRIGFVMADVSGKGVPGLVIMAMVKILAQEFVVSGVSPSQIVSRLNQALRQNIQSNMFVTFFVAILDTRNGRLRFSNAGHNPLLIYNAASRNVRRFKMAGVPLGAFDADMFDTEVQDYQLDLQPGDLVLQYTDGLNETRDNRGSLFGIRRIVEITQQSAASGSLALVERLTREARSFRGDEPQFDDITMLAIGVTAKRHSGRPEAVVRR